MLLRCLGAGDAFGSGGRLNACFYIKHGDVSVLLDCGASSLIALKKAGIDPGIIDIIIISHLHGDHFGGIPFLIRETQISRRREKPLTIIGPPGIESKVNDGLDCFFPGPTNLGTSFEINYLTYSESQRVQLSDISISAWKAIHTPGTNPHSLRIGFGERLIAYSGDTEWYEDLVAISSDADIFICEGYTYSQPKRYHMWIGKLMENKERITARQVVITHLGQDALDNIPNIPFTVANDGDMLFQDEA
ncbi:MAG TPA: MBL fold metallo-hydrolase [Cyclobacteriaceae bacterium]|nr:MBL fold metallo-hydrolase [Cyclobacteriaceae bacterium]